MPSGSVGGQRLRALHGQARAPFRQDRAQNGGGVPLRALRRLEPPDAGHTAGGRGLPKLITGFAVRWLWLQRPPRRASGSNDFETKQKFSLVCIAGCLAGDAPARTRKCRPGSARCRQAIPGLALPAHPLRVLAIAGFFADDFDTGNLGCNADFRESAGIAVPALRSLRRGGGRPGRNGRLAGTGAQAKGDCGSDEEITHERLRKRIDGFGGPILLRRCFNFVAPRPHPNARFGAQGHGKQRCHRQDPACSANRAGPSPLRSRRLSWRFGGGRGLLLGLALGRANVGGWPCAGNFCMRNGRRASGSFMRRSSILNVLRRARRSR